MCTSVTSYLIVQELISSGITATLAGGIQQKGAMRPSTKTVLCDLEMEPNNRAGGEEGKSTRESKESLELKKKMCSIVSCVGDSGSGSHVDRKQTYYIWGFEVSGKILESRPEIKCITEAPWGSQ